jgi:ABC-type transport system substrate-binding protein
MGEGRMRTKSFIAAASLFIALAVPATAQAEPGGPGGANLQAHFYDCTGPAGTPTSFDAVLQVRGAAWHLTDSRQIYEPMIGFDETTNTLVVLTPGFELNAVPTVTCRSVRPDTGHVFRLTGVLT